MTVRQIVIKAKQTSASTIYYDMSDIDKKWIFNTLTKYLADMTEQAHWREDFRELMFTPQKFLQKRFNKKTNRWEQNSIGSMMGGLVYNYRKHDGKNDISKPQLESIERLFELFNKYDSMCQQIEFVDSDSAYEESEHNRDEFFNALFEARK